MNQERDFVDARTAVNSVYPILEAAAGKDKLNKAGQTLSNALKQNDPNAYQSAFQEIYNVAGEILNDINVLRAIDQHYAPVLKVAGISIARIPVAKSAIAACLRVRTTNSFFLDVVLFYFVLICVSIIALFIIYHVGGWLLSWCSWTPRQKPTPMQTPDWSRLWGAVHSPTVGPAYAIQTGQKPSHINIEA